MKIEIEIFQLVSNPDIGFSCNKQSSKNFVLWIDEYEGGHAYDTDWTYVDEFETREELMKYVNDNYGEIKELEIDD